MTSTQTVSIGLIGCGSIAQRVHVPLLTEAGARVTALAGRRLEVAERVARQCGAVAVADWRRLLEREDVDAVVISTPNAQHVEQVLAALDARKHVLVEKPMTTTVADAARVVAAAEAHPALVVMPAQNARFAPVVTAARDVADRQPIRGLRLALRNRGPLAWSPESEWFLDPAQSGGGVLIDLGVHVLDVARFVLGQELDVASAELVRDGGVDVEASVALRSDSGVDVEVEVSWRSDTAGFELELAGADGPIAVAPNLGVPADTVQAAFVRAVRTGAPYSPTAHDGRAAVALVQDAYAAAG